MRTGGEIRRSMEKAGGDESELIVQMRKAAVTLLAPELLVGTLDLACKQTDVQIAVDGRIIGINGRRMFETWYQVEDLILSGRVNLKPIITHEIPFADFEQGFKLMKDGEAIKVILNVEGNDP